MFQNNHNDLFGTYFKTPYGHFCGIPNNGPASRDSMSAVEASHFVHADQPVYTEPGANVLGEGQKVSWRDVTCGVGFQGTVTCESGAHAFTVSAQCSVLF